MSLMELVSIVLPASFYNIRKNNTIAIAQNEHRISHSLLFLSPCNPFNSLSLSDTEVGSQNKQLYNEWEQFADSKQADKHHQLTLRPCPPCYLFWSVYLTQTSISPPAAAQDVQTDLLLQERLCWSQRKSAQSLCRGESSIASRQA